MSQLVIASAVPDHEVATSEAKEQLMRWIYLHFGKVINDWNDLRLLLRDFGNGNNLHDDALNKAQLYAADESLHILSFIFITVIYSLSLLTFMLIDGILISRELGMNRSANIQLKELQPFSSSGHVKKRFNFKGTLTTICHNVSDRACYKRIFAAGSQLECWQSQSHSIVRMVFHLSRHSLLKCAAFLRSNTLWSASARIHHTKPSSASLR